MICIFLHRWVNCRLISQFNIYIYIFQAYIYNVINNEERNEKKNDLNKILIEKNKKNNGRTKTFYDLVWQLEHIFFVYLFFYVFNYNICLALGIIILLIIVTNLITLTLFVSLKKYHKVRFKLI